MALRRFKLIILFIFTISCQSSDEAISIIEPIKSCNFNAQIIIGDNDWIDYTQSNGELQDLNEQTVAQVKIPALFANCTGFLINENVLMTNNHCIPSAQYVNNVSAIFRDASGERTTYLCDDFIVTSAQYDFTLVRCSGNPGGKFGYAGLSSEKAEAIDSIYLVQENCDYIQDPRCVVNKFVAFGSVLKSQSTRIYHDADTLGGSSGSPVFSATNHQVIAIHHAGSPATTYEPAMNLAVPMFQIRKFIETNTSVKIFEYGTAKPSAPVVEDDDCQ